MRFQPPPETSEKSNSAWGKISSAACASSTRSSRAIGHPVMGTNGCCPSDELCLSCTSSSRGFFRSFNLFFSPFVLGFGISDSRCTETTAFVVFMGFVVSQCIWMEKVVSWRTYYWFLWIMAQAAILTPHIWEDLVSHFFVCCAGFTSHVWGSFT